MQHSRRHLLLILALAVAFTAAALHPYGHDFHDFAASEQLECQVCLHHAANPPAAPYQARGLPEPMFHATSIVPDTAGQPTAIAAPAPRARGPPLAI